MTTSNIENVNVTAFDTMPTPEALHALLPLTDAAGDCRKIGLPLRLYPPLQDLLHVRQTHRDA
jgi:hypothetical protein